MRNSTQPRSWDELVEAGQKPPRAVSDPLNAIIPADAHGAEPDDDGHGATPPTARGRSALDTDTVMERLAGRDGQSSGGDGAAQPVARLEGPWREFAESALPELARGRHGRTRRHDPPADPGLHGDGVPPSPSNTTGAAGATTTVRAAVPIDRVADEFYARIPETSWAWVRELWLTPDDDTWDGHLIVEDDAGFLWRIGFTVDGDTIEFTDDPARVEREYRDSDADTGDRDSVAVQAAAGGMLARRFIRPPSTDARPADQGDDR